MMTVLYYIYCCELRSASEEAASSDYFSKVPLNVCLLTCICDIQAPACHNDGCRTSVEQLQEA